MPFTYKLKKTLVAGTRYTAEPDKLYVIKKVGTNSTTNIASLDVAGVKCLEMVQELGRLNPTQFIWYDLYELGDYFIVVPPDKEFGFTGDSASKMIIEGDIVELAPREPIPAALERRLAEQGKSYIKVQRGSYNHGTGTAWAADYEATVLTLTCGAGERHLFDSRLYFSLANQSAVHAAGDWALRIYYQDKPLDILKATMGKFGIDVWNMFWNDGTNYYYYPMELSDMPIQLEPGRTLKINLRNVSGASKSPASGTALIATVALIDKYLMLP
ncbi:MAG: hypothetical protein QW734_11615 [Candidatus Bathyarchaeia archaeon]